MSQLIVDNQNLRSFCEKVEKFPFIAIDTEFIWTNTYRPKLALIQIAANRELYALIDPLAITDKKALQKLLSSKKTVKIFHEAASDLPILYRYCNGVIPEAIFDTRIAAAFCNLGLSCSLKKLIDNFLQIQLENSETRSNWLQRPLTEKQKQYAIEDVIYLPEIAEKLQELLKKYANQDYFNDEMKSFSKTEYYQENHAEETWAKMQNSSNLTSDGLTALKKLIFWREEKAEKLDKPRPFILKDAQIVEICQNLPDNLQSLKAATKLWHSQVKKYGADILTIIKDAKENSHKEKQKNPKMLIPLGEFRNRVKRLQGLIRKKSQPKGIDPVLLAPRKTVQSLVVAAEDRSWQKHPIMKGWRKEFILEHCKELLQSNFQG